MLKTLGDKLDDMLLENQESNEDTFNLSSHLESEINIEYNLQSLMKSDQVYDVDPELIDPDMSDTAFLQKQRLRAETKLIKSRIIYKLDQGHQLSQPEKEYLQEWTKLLKSNSTYNLLNHRDVMVPKHHTESTLKNISAEDMFALNKISNV